MKDKELPITGFEPKGNQFGLRRFGFIKNEDGEWEASITIEGFKGGLREAGKELPDASSGKQGPIDNISPTAPTPC